MQVVPSEVCPSEMVVNGVLRSFDGQPSERTLLDWLRGSGLTGSKQGCAEGDCGACTVILVDRDSSGAPCHRAINSCIALLPTLAGREIITVDGLAGADGLHPVQSSMVEHLGSQCGYCTPGIVMSMFEAAGRLPADASCAAMADQLCGNLCRCTGYRPIRDAAAASIGQGCGKRFAESLRNTTRARAMEVSLKHRGQSFERPASLSALLKLRAENPDAVLVAGATEIGVDVTKKFRRIPKLISLEAVEELRACSSTDLEWRLGASAPLVQIGEVLNGEYPAMDQMLGWFASRQIRNRATLGGNLVTASPIGDSAPVLLALGASVELTSHRGTRLVPLQAFFVGYRQTVLESDEILTAVVLPRLSAPTVKSIFYKVSKRREMDISIVSAAFHLEADSTGVIRTARLAFGGVAATPWFAREASETLIGRNIDSLPSDEIAALLSRAVKPLSDARGSAEYRSGMVASLWRKFASGDQSEAQDEPVAWVSDTVWEGPDPTRFRPHESAVGHVTGSAQYVDDIALRRGGMLSMWPVCSTFARARILSLDVSAALAAPGVLSVLTARDVPGVNDVGCSRQDEPLFADGEVFFHGHILAVIVGESEEACRAASALVQVKYEPGKPIVGIAAAVAENQYLTDPHSIRRGDAAGAIASAPRQLTGEFAFGGQEHFYLETHAAWAEAGPEGDVFVSSSTQHPTEIQIIVSRVLGIPRNRVTVEAPRMGGGFGGKETQGNTWAALAALASMRCGKAVRIQLDRDLDMMLNGKRHPFHSRFQVGFDASGLIHGVRVDLLSDGGWSLDLSMPIMDRALFHLDNAYYFPAVEFTGQVVKTNTASNTAFRGFGGPQGMLVIEEIMDRVARACGIPPEVVRERNLYRGSGPTNTTHFGQDIGDNRIQVLWKDAIQSAQLSERRRELSAWNEAHPMIKRGIAITPVKFGISFTYTPYNQAGALVLAYTDGTVQVNHGGTEMGQGLHTKILGIAMRELGLPAERVRLMFTRTDKVPNTSATAASSGADLNGAAVRNACETLKTQLRPVALEMLEAPESSDIEFADGGVRVLGNPKRFVAFADLCNTAHCRRVPLFATGYYRTPHIHWDRASGKGRPFAYFSCGVAVSEVEVDGWTGMHTVRRVDLLHDVGDSLNPGIDRGQIEGGFVQGMGWLTREELLWDEDGRLLTHSASTYQIPAFSDAPRDFRVRLMQKAHQEGVVHGSKAVGEPPLMLAISVREALKDAVSAFGNQPVALASPATGEAIWKAIQHQLSAK